MTRITRAQAIKIVRFLFPHMSDAECVDEIDLMQRMGHSFLVTPSVRLRARKSGGVSTYTMTGYAADGSDVARILALIEGEETTNV